MNEQFELYLLGLLDERERAEIRAQLDSVEARRAAATVAAMALLAPPVDPPARLRQRVLAGVGAEPVRRGWMAAWLAATAAAMVLLGAVAIRQQQQSTRLAAALNEARQEVARRGTELARANEVLAMLNSPETVVRVSAEGQAAPPQGKVFVNPKQGVLLIASNLRPAPSGRIYEMWVIPAKGNPVPAGLFQSEPSGTALHFFRGAVDIAATGAIAVTLEPEGGVPQPTSTPLIVAPMKKG